MGIFDVDYITQNNSYVQLLAPLCMFQPLIHDLRQTTTEYFVKPAVVHDFWGVKLSNIALFFRSAQLPIKHFYQSNQHIYIHCSLLQDNPV